MFKGHSLSVRGAMHEADGTGCQDSARVYIGADFAVAAVADGHGSEKHFRSAAGSEMATRVAIRSICDFRERNGGLDCIFTENPDNTARRIAANIICGWNSEIAAHFRAFPLNPQETEIFERHGGIADEVMYGATLIVAAMTAEGCFGLQIGDGDFIALDNGEMRSPMPVDTNLVGNLTTSLCDSDAIANFRYFYRRGAFDGVMLSSDGLINSFGSVGDFMSFGRRVLNAVSDDSTASLAEHLHMRSRSGSRDDISIACIVGRE